MKYIYVSIGTLFVVIGAIGLIVPGLPTTPFLLLASFCYIRSSRRLYNWLIGNKIFGPIINDYNIHKAIPAKVKIFSVIMVVLMISLSIFLTELIHLKIIISSFGLIGIITILRIKTF